MALDCVGTCATSERAYKDKNLSKENWSLTISLSVYDRSFTRLKMISSVGLHLV